MKDLLTSWYSYSVLGGSVTTLAGADGLLDLVSGEFTASAGTFVMGLLIFGATVFFAFRDSARKDRHQEHLERVETESRLLAEIKELRERYDALFDKFINQQEQIGTLKEKIGRQETEIQYLQERIKEMD